MSREHSMFFTFSCFLWNLALGLQIFDNTAYKDAAIGAGTLHINWIPNYICQPLIANNSVPSESEWKGIVRQWHQYSGQPLVLDCEDLYLTSTQTANHNLEVMLTLQTWASEEFDNERIGWYGLAGNTNVDLYDAYRQLIANRSNHAFFPSAYTFSSDFNTWNTTLVSRIATSNAIDSTLPIFPHIWPQYHDNPYNFMPVNLWKRELDTLAETSGIDGFVIWGGNNPTICNASCQATAGDQPWLNATRRFLAELKE